MMFDQLVPAEREPAFLNGSQLRPVLPAAGQKGFKSLPPEAVAAINRMRQTQRLWCGSNQTTRHGS